LDRKDLKDSAVFYSYSVSEGDSVYYELRTSISEDSSSFTYYTYAIKNDSLLYWNIYCPTLDTVTFKYNHETIELYMGEYDDLAGADEESYIILEQ
jgi:hypothetical protein